MFYIDRRPSQFCEMSVLDTHCVTDPLRWFCDSLWKVCGIWSGNFDVSYNMFLAA